MTRRIMREGIYWWFMRNYNFTSYSSEKEIEKDQRKSAEIFLPADYADKRRSIFHI